MKQTLPDMNDLLEGINDDNPELETENLVTDDKAAPQPSPDSEQSNQLSDRITDNSPESSANCWNIFLNLSDKPSDDPDRDMRLVCKIDRELADTLDECDIDGLCRSDLVNRIVRAFLQTYLDRMVKFKKNKKSLFKKVANG